jgi:ferredoxin-NADP reductase/Na+-translocating ferredoxin:NAD+ oxidoreductase RnfD subunit
MFEPVDNLLNKITMYRLVLYCLIALAAVATAFGFLGTISYSGISIIISALILLGLGILINNIFAKVFKAITNVESIYISALIMALIIPPIRSVYDIPFYFWAIVLTVASKFIFAPGKKHLFNPVAFAVFVTSVFLARPANWWIGNLVMLPFVAVAGILIVRKIQRGVMFSVFLAVTLAIDMIIGAYNNIDAVSTVLKALAYSPVIFFGSVMFTEPLTTPPKKRLRLMYATIVGVLYNPYVHLGNVYTTPELALLLGNIFSYIVSPKEKLMLTLKQKLQIAPTIVDFIFQKDRTFAYEPGQYLEWTLGHSHPDSRGNRRYFTLASAPTEENVRIGVKFYPNSSSFKKRMKEMKPGENISAGQLAGDFTLPRNEKEKLVFIAGGIGVTPYRSIVKNMLDTGKERDVIILYSVKHPQDLVYQDVFNEAAGRFGIKVLCFATEVAENEVWNGRTGHIDQNVITSEVPDYKERTFYLSGPRSMVRFFENELAKLGVSKRKIKTDFFPGYA